MEGEGDGLAGLEPLDDGTDNGLGKENLPVVVGPATVVPAFIADGGERAGYAFVDFFTAQIRNPNTRAAYATAVRAFCAWCDVQRLTLRTLRTHHVAAYVEQLGRTAPKLDLSPIANAIRLQRKQLVVWLCRLSGGSSTC